MQAHTQVPVPLKAMPKVVFAKKEQLKKAMKRNPGSLNNLGIWNSGTSARAVIALLKLTSVLCQISNDYGDQVQEEIKAVTTIADATGETQIAQGEDEFKAMLSQGVTSIIGGVATIGISLLSAGTFNKSETEQLEQEELGTKVYSDKIEEYLGRDRRAGLSDRRAEQGEVDPETMEDHYTAIKDKDSEALRKLGQKKMERQKLSQETDSLLSDERSLEESIDDDSAIKVADSEKLKEMKKAYDEKLKDIRERRRNLELDSQNKLSKLENFTRAAGETINGIGTTAAANFQLEKAKDQAEETRERADLQMIEGILGQNRGDQDKYFQSALEVNQVINAIRQANQIN